MSSWSARTGRSATRPARPTTASSSRSAAASSAPSGSRSSPPAAGCCCRSRCEARSCRWRWTSATDGMLRSASVHRCAFVRLRGVGATAETGTAVDGRVRAAGRRAGPAGSGRVRHWPLPVRRGTCRSRWARRTSGTGSGCGWRCASRGRAGSWPGRSIPTTPTSTGSPPSCCRCAAARRASASSTTRTTPPASRSWSSTRPPTPGRGGRGRSGCAPSARRATPSPTGSSRRRPPGWTPAGRRRRTCG